MTTSLHHHHTYTTTTPAHPYPPKNGHERPRFIGIQQLPVRKPVAHAAIQAVRADGVNEMVGFQDDTVRPRMNRRFGVAVYGNAEKAAQCGDADEK